MHKRRKRKLILEKHKKPLDTSYVFYSTNNVPAYRFNHNQVNQGSLFNGFEPYKSNRFMVFLENEYSNKTISPDRIKSLHFSHTIEHGNIITIESMLAIGTNDWMDEYKDMHICKIDLLDPTGVVVKSMDFDVALIKYEYKLNYSESDFLLPRFYYKIFD